MIKRLIIKYFPSVGVFYRFFCAFYYKIVAKNHYSQHGEDLFLEQCFAYANLKNINYIDVGCNHPMRINNTYFLYKRGAKGVCIDANDEFEYLYKLFRGRDLFLPFGVGALNGLAKFNISRTPVISSFNNIDNSLGFKLVPIFTLDEIMKSVDIKLIDFLNVDVEGLNLDVLEGAINTLKLVNFICVEFDTDEEKEKIKNILFDFICLKEIGCNLFFQRKDMMKVV